MHPPADMKAITMGPMTNLSSVTNTVRTISSEISSCTEVEIFNHIKGALAMELFDVPRDHPSFPFLRLYVHLTPRVGRGKTRTLEHKRASLPHPWPRRAAPQEGQCGRRRGIATRRRYH